MTRQTVQIEIDPTETVRKLNRLQRIQDIKVIIGGTSLALFGSSCGLWLPVALIWLTN